MEHPARVALANLPTPLVHLPRTSGALGVEFWIKRDDLSGSELSGNKVRKLEYLLADAKEQGADTLITCGGEQSNHCRATAMVAAKLGLRCILLLRTKDPANPPANTGNILLDRLAGAEIRWISYPEYGKRYELFDELSEELKSAGHSPYVIVEGGSSAVGCWGYVGCCEELALDLSALPKLETSVVYACGSGGTGAGLILGNKLTGLAQLDLKIAGINVCDDRDYFVKTIGTLCQEFDQRYETQAAVIDDEIDIIDGYVGKGYAQASDEEIREWVALCRRDGIVLDPVYSGKAYYGLVQELRKDPTRFGDRVVFVHTGGIFGTLAQSAIVEKHL